MEKTSKELLKEYVNSQHFTSTADIMNGMKELFSDMLQTVMERRLGIHPRQSDGYRIPLYYYGHDFCIFVNGIRIWSGGALGL